MRAAAVQHWGDAAARLVWERAFATVCEPEPGPDARWFIDGELSVAANCLDRHLEARGEQPALLWEGEPGDTRQLTYRELAEEVAAFASGLAGLGVGVGDRVALYLGLVPETVVAMLACARLGAVHCLLASTLPHEALADRLVDLDPRVLITEDGSWRGGVVLPLKARADEALAATRGVEHTVVVRRTGIDVAWYEGDRWYHDVRQAGATDPVPPTVLPADAPLLIVYLPDRRGAPTGIVHRCAGYLVYAETLHRQALTCHEDDVFWCAVDIAWLAGQTHAVYGPLAAGATTVLVEGTLASPTQARTWQIIERYGVNAFVTTPSVARSLRHWVDAPPGKSQLSSLRSIVHLGEPIDPATRAWLCHEVGGAHAVVRDGWGQVELGAIVTVEPAPDPPLPDPGLDVVDEQGRVVGLGEVGELVLTNPWPGTMLGTRHARPPARPRWWRYPGCYATGDRARRERDGRISVLGRIDPVINVSGRLVSAEEVGDALAEHPRVVWSIAAGCPDERSGQAVVAGVVLDPSVHRDADLVKVGDELRLHVHDSLGGLARPRVVAVLETVPSAASVSVLRAVVSALCAAQRSPVLRLSDAQVGAAVAAYAAMAATIRDE